MSKEELFECLSGLSQTNNLRDGIDIRKEEANIIVNEIERLNNIINELEKLELYEYTPDYDYDENLVDDYTPFNIENYIEELIGSNKENV